MIDRDPLQQEIIDRLRLLQQQQPSRPAILLMSHLVLGYPSLEDNRRVIAAMVAAGVDLIELQIPFSEPIADGPVIAHANQQALERGFRLGDGLALIAEMIDQYRVPFLIMSYANILEVYGQQAFIDRAAAIGVRGLIVPDLPIEESAVARQHCRDNSLAWIALLAPNSSEQRLKSITDQGQGFCYCVARKGVTGQKSQFGEAVNAFIGRCRRATTQPLAVGFGVRQPSDIQQLRGIADIAVVGSAAIEVHQQSGLEAIHPFFTALRG
ncbi:MAG: tryptophan synthase subunit alpha [Magnetococcales bacterium]|nr:tryptophan synthase subunit alpha [Magnetococcales bacterium]